MTVTASVTIDRSSLSLPALTISGTSPGTYVLTDRGLGRPAMAARLAYYPDVPEIDGSKLRAASKEQSSLPLEVRVQASSSAALEQAIADLDQALWQFSYTVTTSIGGVSRTWQADPGSWSPAEGGTGFIYASQFMEILAVTIPVYPIPS